ncbi:transposase domain-containing protein [Ketobacter sp.]
MRYVLERIGSAETLDQIEALLPWNVPLEPVSKNAQADGKGK